MGKSKEEELVAICGYCNRPVKGSSTSNVGKGIYHPECAKKTGR